MKNHDGKRKTKKDKAKRNVELNGKFSSKHLRKQAELQIKSSEKKQTENDKKTNES